MVRLIIKIISLNYVFIFVCVFVSFFNPGPVSYIIPYLAVFSGLLLATPALFKHMQIPFMIRNPINYFHESSFPLQIIVLFFAIITTTGFLISVKLGFSIFSDNGSINLWYLLLVPVYVLPVALPIWWGDLLRKQGYDYRE